MGWLLAILSGLLAGLSYPTRFGFLILPDLGFLGFFCWVPLMFALQNANLKRAFLLSFLAGMIHYSLSQFWLFRAINTFGGLSQIWTIFAMMVLFSWLAFQFSAGNVLAQFCIQKLKYPPILVRPFFWIGVQYLRHHMPANGYPWSQLGYSQGGFLHFIQSADLFGVFGITLIMLWINEAITAVLHAKSQYRLKRTFYYSIPIGIIILLNLGYGRYQIKKDYQPDDRIKIGVVQGNIPQEDKWQRGKAKEILGIHLNETFKLEDKGADLIIWPEASFPYRIYYDEPKLHFKLPKHKLSILLGSVTSKRKKDPEAPFLPLHNSAILLNEQDDILGYYHKVQLVPFGEYVPYPSLLSFVPKLAVDFGRMLPGEVYQPINFKDYKLGMLICYEDIYPEPSREMVRNGATALVNITNDAWYGYSSAAYQHQVFSQFRAIETRRDLIRVTNTGISSLINPKGRILWQGGLFERQSYLTELKFYRGETLYVRLGDVLPLICLTMSAILLIVAKLRGKLVKQP